MIRTTFLDIDEASFQEADVVIVPVPYDVMSSYKTGASAGPAAILAASRQVEWYDEELKKEIPSLCKIFTADLLEPEKSSPEAMVRKAEAKIGEILDQKKLPIMIGGDHSLSIGATLAVAEHFPDAGILHLDAHTDLRESWEGSEYSHACSMRHVLARGLKLVQVGIRSTDREIEEGLPKEWQNLRKVFWAPNVPVDQILKQLPEKVYVSIDLDVFDPSMMPAVGTPEPGGLSWYDICSLLKTISRERTILGFDIMELAPIPGIHYPEFTAAKLITKFLGYIFYGK